MESPGAPEIKVETIWRTILITDARNSSKAYFSERSEEALVRIERDRALFGRIAAEHGGEEVRDRGDGSMFAFCDPVAAVRAAMAMQREIAGLNASLPEGKLRLVHRMGVHVGPIKLATTYLRGSHAPRLKMTGDIVVMAARLEEIAHPGEVCFSNDVYKAIRGKIDHDFRYLDSTLKGFERPMRCWSTRLDRSWARPLTAEEEETRARQRDERRYRERWEREQRELRQRRTMLWSSSLAAVLSLTFAGIEIFRARPMLSGKAPLRLTASSAVFELDLPVVEKTPEIRPSLHRKAARGEAAGTRGARAPELLEIPERDAAPVRPASRKATRPRRAAPPPSSAQVGAALRQALASGRLEEVPTRLSAMRLSGGRFDSAVDAAQRFQRARDWLAARLEALASSDEGGLALDPPVAGFALLNGVSDQGLGGLDGSGYVHRVGYLDLSPDDFARLLRAAATDDDPPPDDPDAAAQSLAALLGGGRR